MSDNYEPPAWRDPVVICWWVCAITIAILAWLGLGRVITWVFI